ncbi:cytochrome c oxidase subunit II [Rhodoluna lacicola]|uniref:aa3-type cytochrome oxidase subunit II n=1 Tax=Rhodoluna lacicola TaxID=529884 RepID=UPI002231688A|nr:cytochrome c oxidase subunit II [Rhodoluna lacicola]BDS50540.1 cytochrome c oxidase subunit II [Rhodoluna lacicola]
MLKKRGLKWAVLPVAASLMLLLSGCSQQEFSRGFLPGVPGVTNHTDRITGLWTTSWIVLWGIGLIAWGLMFYAVIVYRRRKGETGLPPQLRYNNPIETMFTVVPLIITIGFFAFTARDMAAIEEPNANPDVTIQVIAKQWSWDFNYVDGNVYDSGIQSQFDGELGSEAALPTLYLPVNKSVKVDLSARDVIHSFWVIDFLYKKDMFPGRTNYMYFTPQVEGTYKGKCAELCGEFHSMMLFNVKVVSQAEYDAHLAALAAAGNVGQLDNKYDRNQNLPGDNPEIRG